MVEHEMYIQSIRKEMEIAVLNFVKGGKQATIVTNGERVHTYEESGRKVHKKLSSAISYLECRGYHIYIE